MRKLCLISHGQPSANPRLVRDANILAESGYDVRVVTAQIMPQLATHDEGLAAGAKWQYEPLIFHRRSNGSPSWNYVRTRRRMSATFATWLPTEALVARASGYAAPELADAAARLPADLFIAYQHNSLPAAAWAAEKYRARFALDAQDLLADCRAELVPLIQSIERRYLQRCAYVSTMSRVAASRLKETNKLTRDPLVLRNTPRMSERDGVIPPDARERSGPISLYWFGQTLGKGSCADQILEALPLLSRPVRLALRGNPNDVFVTQLRQRAEALGLSEQLLLLPRAEPSEMVRLAGEHDVLLGTQPGTELFNQMAIGNKVFTGMMAGMALALSDTIAHRELLAEAGGCGFLFPDRDIRSLASQLDKLITNPDELQRMKVASWELAEKKFNWEEESKTLLQELDRILSVPAVATTA
jgi:glycosyltransferase involved in cell wall biosynthesis